MFGTLFALLVAASILLGACAPAAAPTAQPADPEKTEAPAATEAPAVVDAPVKTILGDFYWDERGLPINKPFIVIQWQDGKLEFVFPTDAFPGVKPLIFPKPGR